MSQSSHPSTSNNPRKPLDSINSFSELALSPELQKAIDMAGYTTPSAIQAQALPILLGAPTDFIGLAATGTGKTAAFTIPLLEKMDLLDPDSKGKVKGLVLCPTRELANQVSQQVQKLGTYKGIKVATVYGGAGYPEQIRALKAKPEVVVGTPGRLIDHLSRGILDISNLQNLILDEADEMISMGFKDELDTILQSIPRETCRIWLFSATMSPAIREVAAKYLQAPKQVQVNRQEVVPASVEQTYVIAKEGHKADILCKLIDDAGDDFYGLIFCQTKALVADLAQFLHSKSYKVESLHGDKDQSARERTLQQFRDRKINILVCTDVASRGLDVHDITHVINFSLPREIENYIHRIGRTARSGKSGKAISLVTPSFRYLLSQIERRTKMPIREGAVPSRKHIATKKVGAFLGRFQDQSQHQRASDLLNDTWRSALEGMTREEIAGRFLALQFPDMFLQPEATPLKDVVQGRAQSTSDRTPSSGRSHDREQGRDHSHSRDREREMSDAMVEEFKPFNIAEIEGRGQRPGRSARPSHTPRYERNRGERESYSSGRASGRRASGREFPDSEFESGSAHRRPAATAGRARYGAEAGASSGSSSHASSPGGGAKRSKTGGAKGYGAKGGVSQFFKPHSKKKKAGETTARRPNR